MRWTSRARVEGAAGGAGASLVRATRLLRAVTCRSARRWVRVLPQPGACGPQGWGAGGLVGSGVVCKDIREGGRYCEWSTRELGADTVLHRFPWSPYHVSLVPSEDTNAYYRVSCAGKSLDLEEATLASLIIMSVPPLTAGVGFAPAILLGPARHRAE
jgi:hypothetical protein